MRNTSEINDANGVAAVLDARPSLPALGALLAQSRRRVPDRDPAGGQRISAGDVARQSLARARGTLEFIDPRRSDRSAARICSRCSKRRAFGSPTP